MAILEKAPNVFVCVGPKDGGFRRPIDKAELRSLISATMRLYRLDSKTDEQKDALMSCIKFIGYIARKKSRNKSIYTTAGKMAEWRGLLRSAGVLETKKGPARLPAPAAKRNDSP